MDSSALFAAVISSTGAARELILKSINEEVLLVISEDVVEETTRNISRKAPELLPLFDRFLGQTEFEIVSSPSKEAVWTTEHYVSPKDAFIIAAAIDAKVDYVATFDRKHLIEPPEVRKKSGLIIDTPGNILSQIRYSLDED